MNVTCSSDECPLILNSACVFYEGTNLSNIGVVTNDSLQTVLEKINDVISDSSGTILAVTASPPLFSSGGTSPNISMPVATPGNSGYLSATDWNNFNNKQSTGLSWLLATGATLTGVNVITSNIANQLSFTGTWPATADLQNNILFGGSFTGRASQPSDQFHAYDFKPTLIGGSGGGTYRSAVNIEPTFVGGGLAYALRVIGSAVIVGQGVGTGLTLILADSTGVSTFSFQDNGRVSFTTTPQNDDALTQILVRDAGNGEIKYRNAASLASSYSWLLASGGTLTGNNVITENGFTLKFIYDNLITTPIQGAGIWIANTTAATSLVPAQISPAIVWEGQSWKTNVTAETQTIKFMSDILTAQGVDKGQGTWRLRFNVNGGAFADAIQINTGQGVAGGTAGIMTIGVNSGQQLVLQSNQVTMQSQGGSGTLGFISNGGSAIWNLGTISSPTGSSSFQVTSSLTVAAANHNYFDLVCTVNSTSTGLLRIISPRVTFTDWDGDVVGYEWDPTTPTNIAGVHYAARFVSGKVLIGGSVITAGSVSLELQSTSTALLLNRIAGTPGTPVSGMLWYNSTESRYGIYNGAIGYVLTYDTSGVANLGYVNLGGISRTIQVSGSGTDIGLNLYGTGEGAIQIAALGGGGVTIGGTNKTTAGTPNNVTVSGSGASSSATGAGKAFLTGGVSNITAIKAGDAIVKGGNAQVGDANGGDTYISTGAGHGTGVAGNLGLFTESGNFGSGVKVMYIANADTNATTAPTNGFILHAKDSSDGGANSTLALYTEQAVEAIGVFTASHKIKVWWNNVEYWLQLDAV